jgi:hypothetical protein
MNITLEEYKAEILDLATNIMADYGENDDDDIFGRIIHEALDGHEWLTSTAYRGDVAQLSDNSKAYLDDYDAETLGQIVIERGVEDITFVIAAYAMAVDVTQEVQRMITEGSW